MNNETLLDSLAGNRLNCYVKPKRDSIDELKRENEEKLEKIEKDSEKDQIEIKKGSITDIQKQILEILSEDNDIRQDYIIKCMKQGDNIIDIFEFPSRYMFPTYLMSQYYYEHRGDIKFILRNYDEWKDVIENE